jgi:sulfide:quinone oxidoreductase
MNAPNAKTAAAARKQAPGRGRQRLSPTSTGAPPSRIYNGYGSCPLTVEKGKIVLAEFGYGGKLLPSFPKWLIDGTKPSRAAWFLKETHAAADLLEGDAARQGMDGQAEKVTVG